MNEKELSLGRFLDGLNVARRNISNSEEHRFALLSVLADLVQIQCLKSANNDLLRFRLPLGIYPLVQQLGRTLGSEFTTLESASSQSFELTFKNEDEQDKFILLFESLSFEGKRAFFPPDIYLGNEHPDIELCEELLKILSDVGNSDFGGGAHQSKKSSKAFIVAIQIGSITLSAELENNDMSSTPRFVPIDQPTRCYLVEFSDGFSKFFWSKPGEYGDNGVFTTVGMAEALPLNGERYFNDAYHEDPTVYSVTLTLTNQPFNDGKAFLYRQKFEGWAGAFAGSLSPIEIGEVPDGWMALFVKNAP